MNCETRMLTMVIVKITVFWDVKQYNFIYVYLRVGVTCCFLLQNGIQSQALNTYFTVLPRLLMAPYSVFLICITV
jgi:hypothetical protein